MISVVTASTLVAYVIFTVSPDTIAKFHTDRLGLTLPFPLYGIFRYLYLVHRKEGGGSPSDMLLADKPLLSCVASGPRWWPFSSTGRRSCCTGSGDCPLRAARYGGRGRARGRSLEGKNWQPCDS